MIVTRSLSPASWRKPSEMARTANFVPEYAGTINVVRLSHTGGVTVTRQPLDIAREISD